MPVLTIVGGWDVLLDSTHTRERLQRNVPQAEICFLEEGYHFLPGHTARIMTFFWSAFSDRCGERFGNCTESDAHAAYA